MTCYFQVCGMTVCCQTPFELQITEETRPFLCQACTPDLVFRFEPVPGLPAMPADGFWVVNDYYARTPNEDVVYFCPAREHPAFARVFWQETKPDEMTCEYIAGKEADLCYSRNILEMLSLESFLLRHGGILLHASLIAWNGRGILFSAPSGTGKSTQADLWQSLEGAQILNGDRAGLTCEGGTWRAWGLPYAGSSGIYRNESAEVSALIVLRQATQNRIFRATPMEAVRWLYPELTVHRWDAKFTNQAVDLLVKLVSGVPVYLLECLPEPSAVALLKQEIMKGELL